MTKEFDPYYKWLGIPPRDQPPNHYRLLGIEVFESDRDVIDAAANRVMAYLKDLAAGDEAEYSQSLLNEVSRARICLLNKEKKKSYDKELRADLKSKGVPEPKAAKPAAKPPTKKRKETNGEAAAPPQAPPGEPWPKIHVDGEKPESTADDVVYAEPDETEDEQPIKRTRWKLLVSAAVGGLLLAGAIVLAVFFFLGRDSDRLASTHNGDSQGDPSASTTNGDGSDPESDPESDPSADPESDPETDPESDPESDPEPALETDPDTSSKPETDPESDPAPESKANTDTTPDADAGTPNGDVKPKTRPDGSSDAESTLPDWSEDPDDGSEDGSAKPDDEPPTDDPADPKDTGTSPDDTMIAKVDPNTDPPPKPVVPKPPAKPTQKPFQDLPLVASLPDLEAADALTPKAIGPIYCQTDDLCFIKLRGGETARKGSQTFVMRNADGGLAERDWEVFSREGESDPETKIAHLSLDDQSQLSFQWQPEAKTVPLSAHLCNCAFSFSCSGESHVVTLRQVAQVEGMTLELGKPSTDEHWKIDMSPDPTNVRVEITGLQGAQYTVQPAPVIEADKGETWLELEDGGGLLSLKVETEMKRNLEVTVTPYLKSPAPAQPTKFNARLFGQALTQRKQQLAQAPFMIQQMKQVAGQASGRERTLMEQRVAQAEQAQVELQTAVDNAQKLADFLENAGGNLRLQFRVFYDADSSEVDLLHIGG